MFWNNNEWVSGIVFGKLKESGVRIAGDLEAVCLLSDVDRAGDGVEDGWEEVLKGAQVISDCAKLKKQKGKNCRTV